ncbi:MAG: hypothetical protein Fues2KO_14500 [Fuerstiella sp.]
MSRQINLFSVQSPVPRAVGFLISFLTVGIGVLRSVGPTELVIRAMVAGTVSYLIVRQLTKLWDWLSEEALHRDSDHD